MDRKTNVMDMQVVKTSIKANIVDEGLDVFYQPMFYSEKQAYRILQQLKSELVYDSSKASSFNPEVMSFGSAPKVPSEDKEHLSTGSKQSAGSKKSTIGSGSWNSILMKIQSDIEMKLRIKLNLCLADWHEDGKGTTIHNEEDISPGSSIVMMSFGPPRDLLLTWNNSEQSEMMSNLVRPNFSSYKINMTSGSFL